MKKRTHKMPNGKVMAGARHEKKESAKEQKKEYGRVKKKK